VSFDFLKRRMPPLRVLDDYTGRPGIRPKTINTYLERLTPFCSLYRNKAIGEINQRDVDRWIVSLEERFPSQASVDSWKQTLKSFFAWCVKVGYVKKNPAAHVHYRRRLSARDKAVPADNIRKVVDYLMGLLAVANPRPLDIRDLLAVSLSRDSGKRLSELANLSTKLMNKALQNPQMASSGILVYTATSGRGKTGQVKLRFTEHTAAVYRLWQMRRPDVSAASVFIALGGKDSGKPLTTDGFSTIFVRRCKEAGVPPFRTHAVRHQRGTDVTDKYSPAVAAAVLGISVETAMLHYYDEAAKKAIDAVAGY
jgi:site-specific recombinase XerD